MFTSSPIELIGVAIGSALVVLLCVLIRSSRKTRLEVRRNTAALTDLKTATDETWTPAEIERKIRALANTLAEDKQAQMAVQLAAFADKKGIPLWRIEELTEAHASDAAYLAALDAGRHRDEHNPLGHTEGYGTNFANGPGQLIDASQAAFALPAGLTKGTQEEDLCPTQQLDMGPELADDGPWWPAEVKPPIYGVWTLPGTEEAPPIIEDTSAWFNGPEGAPSVAHAASTLVAPAPRPRDEADFEVLGATTASEQRRGVQVNPEEPADAADKIILEARLNSLVMPLPPELRAIRAAEELARLQTTPSQN